METGKNKLYKQTIKIIQNKKKYKLYKQIQLYSEWKNKKQTMHQHTHIRFHYNYCNYYAYKGVFRSSSLSSCAIFGTFAPVCFNNNSIFVCISPMFVCISPIYVCSRSNLSAISIFNSPIC
eukprot:368605_1